MDSTDAIQPTTRPAESTRRGPQVPPRPPSAVRYPMPPPPPAEAAELPNGEAELAQSILDLLHTQNAPPMVAALACVIAAGSFHYMASDKDAPPGKAHSLAAVLNTVTALHHMRRPKEPGALLPKELQDPAPPGKSPRPNTSAETAA